MSVIEVRSPVDHRVAGVVQDTDAAAVSRTVGSLRSAQRGWGDLPPRRRGIWLQLFREWLQDNESELVSLLCSETGKPEAEARLELPYVVEAINYHSRRVSAVLAEQRPRRHGILAATKHQLLVQRPYPVVGVITPWNFPLGLSLLDAVPALLAGAAVVVKPSEHAPLSVLAAIRGWTEVGAPPVLSAVTGGVRTGAAVVDCVDFVQFTGSVGTGRTIARAAAERLVPCALELGGKDAMIVLADANVERAANAAVWGAMANSGQMCVSVERVYVEAAVYDSFVAAVVENVRRLRPADLGPLGTQSQIAIVERHVREAINDGAVALVGGTRADRPTVLVNVDHSMACMREETFGPVLPIMRVDDVDDAVRLTNDSCYGLSASIFSGDRARAEQVARRIETGAVNINDVFGNLFTLALPQGGWKESGVGTRNGAHAILKFCRPQSIVSARWTPTRELTWYPYSSFRRAVVHRASRVLGARGFRRRFIG